MNATHNDNQGSDSDSEYDFVGTESVDTSNNEHISEESDLSNFDIEQGDVVTTSQPETLQKDGIIRQSRPLYCAAVSLQRFKHLFQFIRFDDRETRDKSDRLGLIRYIFELFVKQLPKHFVPCENLTVDEQLVPLRGRCCLVQYIPNKPAKYGLKFWVLSDVDGRYVLSIDLFIGKKGNQIQKNVAANVVLNLVDHLPNNVKQGRCIIFDRYFTDIKLSEAFLDRKMTSIEVVEQRRSFLPDELKVCRQNLFSS
ncbi:unnamed protein product [Rotaria sordida]|uniref:PiggyBac transposable element-derived protein domain-containing protein n=2 Tax=Rotaria sordida TaxID=392033 RepID=A0A814Y9F3_9BILA|nr:unnamed protein product [Rotaria sordida]CAF1508513.1 unnamed protein product [Rotaria sordida]